MKGRFWRKALAASLALLIVTGSVPIKPISNMFESMVVTAEAVEEVTKRTREYVITGANPVPYEFDTEETMTAAELTKALQDREVALAENKKRTEEYYASQGSSKPAQAAPAAAVPQGGFKF